MRTIALVGFLATGILFSVSARADDTWKKIENSSFSFSVPQSFKKTDQHGIDSFVEEYVSEGIKLAFDYGIYSGGFSDWSKETKFDDLKIDGKAARIGTKSIEPHNGFLYFTQVHIKLDGAVALDMFADCRSEKEVALAKKIFETIVFKSK